MTRGYKRRQTRGYGPPVLYTTSPHDPVVRSREPVALKREAQTEHEKGTVGFYQWLAPNDKQPARCRYE